MVEFCINCAFVSLKATFATSELSWFISETANINGLIYVDEIAIIKMTSNYHNFGAMSPKPLILTLLVPLLVSYGSIYTLDLIFGMLMLTGWLVLALKPICDINEEKILKIAIFDILVVLWAYNCLWQLPADWKIKNFCAVIPRLYGRSSHFLTLWSL